MQLKSIILIILLVSSSFTVYVFPQVEASSDSVTVTSTNTADKTVLQVSNNAGSASDIVSFTLEIKTGIFKSFKLDSGWIGKKTSLTTISFISSNPIKPGSSSKFEIKTDQQTPYLTWKVFDANNNELGSGEIGAPQGTSTGAPQGTSTGAPQGTSTGAPQGTSTGAPQGTPASNVGILDSSSFRIIPSSPRPGYDIRVAGQSFSALTNLDLYIGDNKIYSFSSNEKGNFVVTTKVPDKQQPGGVTFVLKDQQGNQKTFTTTIKGLAQNRATSLNIPLTLTVDSIYHRGETKQITGTANPGSTVTISILDSSGKTITTFTAKADAAGNYSAQNVIPIDMVFGKYTVIVSDGKNQVSKDYEVVTTHQILVTTLKQKYNPGDTVMINGTAAPNQLISFVITNPIGIQIYTKDQNVTSDGKVSASYQLDGSAIKGTYIIAASQGSDEIPIYFGVGEEPVPALTAILDKLNYQNTDKPSINVSGPPSSTLNLVIVDPSDKQKFADTILLGPDGLATYSFNLTSYTPGIYSAVITRGNDKTVKDFAVGLQIGSGNILLRTIKDTYLPGDSLILLGNSNPNTIIQLSLIDPNGNIVKSSQTFTDKNGMFSSFEYRIPGNANPGIWKLDAASGINHKSLHLNVKSVTQKISIDLDKDPPVYSPGDSIRISGTDAGVSSDLNINLRDSNSTKVLNLQIQSTNRGEFSTVWTIPKDFAHGTYTMEVSSIAGKAAIKLTIQ